MVICKLSANIRGSLKPWSVPGFEGLRKAVEIAHGVEGGKTVLEASGGIDLTTSRAIAGTGVDRIAVGGITHSAQALDIGLDLVEVLG